MRCRQEAWARCPGLGNGIASLPRTLYLLKGALVLHTLGPHKHPAVPEGELLDVLAAQIAEKLPGLFVHPAAQKEKV